MDVTAGIRNEREQMENNTIFGGDLSDLKMKRCFERDVTNGIL